MYSNCFLYNWIKLTWEFINNKKITDIWIFFHPIVNSLPLFLDIRNPIDRSRQGGQGVKEEILGTKPIDRMEGISDHTWRWLKSDESGFENTIALDNIIDNTIVTGHYSRQAAAEAYRLEHCEAGRHVSDKRCWLNKLSDYAKQATASCHNNNPNHRRA